MNISYHAVPQHLDNAMPCDMDFVQVTTLSQFCYVDDMSVELSITEYTYRGPRAVAAGPEEVCSAVGGSRYVATVVWWILPFLL